MLGVELVVLGQVDRALAHRSVFFCWAVLPGEEKIIGVFKLHKL